MSRHQRIRSGRGMSNSRNPLLALNFLPALLLAPLGAQAQQAPADGPLEEVTVIGTATTYAVATVTPETLERLPVLGSVNGALNELPGVAVTEADPYGSSAWGTQISMRGFVANRDRAQIGTTIDGLPNGGSLYAGGAMANRYIDTLDLKTIEVSQGTADVSSRSNEALGGTLNFLTSDPLGESRLRLLAGSGSFDASKYYVRYDSPELFGNTIAFFSASSARNSDWIDGSSTTSRDHLNGKFISDLGALQLTGYLSYDDADESEYVGVTLDQFRADPDHDLLTGELTGIPYIDQNYREGSRALRENTFVYLKAAFDVTDGLKGNVAGYLHKMEGRGDWIPQYLVDVTDDGAGQPNSEFIGGSTVVGGPQLGTLKYLTPTGATAQQIPGCIGSATLPAEYNPACYPVGSVPVQSYRHTHYDNDRHGFTGDLDWRHALGTIENTVRGGLWFENFDRMERRDWHRLTNIGINIAFDNTPYYTQWQDDFTSETRMAYVEDVMDFGALKARAGVKRFWIDQSRDRVIGDNTFVRSNSKSDPLVSLGVTWQAADGIEAFAGFSQNYAAIFNNVLQRTNQLALNEVEPETADNIEIGMRVDRGPLLASATLYSIKFDNRIEALTASLVDGIDYLGQNDVLYLNVGGIESKGIEALVNYRVGGGWVLGSSYTYNDSKYEGTGDAAQDAALNLIPGAQVAGAAEHTLVASADWRGDVWNFGISGRYTGKRPLDRANDVSLSAVTIWNANVGFDLSDISPRLKGASANLVVTNLTDKSYLSGVENAGSTAFIGAPRTVVFSFNVDL
jgi:outer membrane receptor protein involved in Fe transport